MNNIYINIKDVAEAKGLKSTRSIRLELNKTESKYISRVVQVNGGTSYEILFSSLEPELQDKLRKNERKSTELVPLNYKPQQFVSDHAKLTANYRTNIVLALIKYRNNYSTKKQADSEFLDLYNSGLYLPKAYKFIGSISLGTLHRWVRKYEKHESAECLQPNYAIDSPPCECRGTSPGDRVKNKKALAPHVHLQEKGSKIARTLVSAWLCKNHIQFKRATNCEFVRLTSGISFIHSLIIFS